MLPFSGPQIYSMNIGKICFFKYFLIFGREGEREREREHVCMSGGGTEREREREREREKGTEGPKQAPR